jgi:hypothetical protein
MHGQPKRKTKIRERKCGGSFKARNDISNIEKNEKAEESWAKGKISRTVSQVPKFLDFTLRKPEEHRQ